jgi:hypothetical protein
MAGLLLQAIATRAAVHVAASAIDDTINNANASARERADRARRERYSQTAEEKEAIRARQKVRALEAKILKAEAAAAEAAAMHEGHQLDVSSALLERNRTAGPLGNLQDHAMDLSSVLLTPPASRGEALASLGFAGLTDPAKLYAVVNRAPVGIEPGTHEEEVFAMLDVGTVVYVHEERVVDGHTLVRLHHPDCSPCSTDERRPLGGAYVQDMTVGLASYHFEGDQEAYISYAANPGWTLSDGSAPPKKKAFDDTSFDEETRTFKGTINWAPVSFDGDVKWEYEMIFAEDYQSIVAGQVTSTNESGVSSTGATFGQTLWYKQFAAWTSLTGRSGEIFLEPCSSEAQLYTIAEKDYTCAYAIEYKALYNSYRIVGGKGAALRVGAELDSRLLDHRVEQDEVIEVTDVTVVKNAKGKDVVRGRCSPSSVGLPSNADITCWLTLKEGIVEPVRLRDSRELPPGTKVEALYNSYRIVGGKGAALRVGAELDSRLLDHRVEQFEVIEVTDVAVVKNAKGKDVVRGCCSPSSVGLPSNADITCWLTLKEGIVEPVRLRDSRELPPGTKVVVHEQVEHAKCLHGRISAKEYILTHHWVPITKVGNAASHAFRWVVHPLYGLNPLQAALLRLTFAKATHPRLGGSLVSKPQTEPEPETAALEPAPGSGQTTCASVQGLGADVMSAVMARVVGTAPPPYRRHDMLTDPTKFYAVVKPTNIQAEPGPEHDPIAKMGVGQVVYVLDEQCEVDGQIYVRVFHPKHGLGFPAWAPVCKLEPCSSEAQLYTVTGNSESKWFDDVKEQYVYDKMSSSVVRGVNRRPKVTRHLPTGSRVVVLEHAESAGAHHGRISATEWMTIATADKEKLAGGLERVEKGVQLLKPTTKVELEEAMIEVGVFNSQSKWFQVTKGKRAYYKEIGTLGISLKPPSEGVAFQTEAETEEAEEEGSVGTFVQWLTWAEMTDAGLFNPRSMWIRFTDGERTYYCTLSSRVYTLQPPPEGVAAENLGTFGSSGVLELGSTLFEERDAKQFEDRLQTAEMMDAGLLNSQSTWGKVTSGERAYYYNFDTEVYSLQPPPEGCWHLREEVEEEGSPCSTDERRPLGGAYVQDMTVGLASFHFEGDQAYISYAANPGWTLSDGSAPPEKKAFDDTSFDEETRTFKGTINWAPVSFDGDVKWEYVLTSLILSCTVSA